MSRRRSPRRDGSLPGFAARPKAADLRITAPGWSSPLDCSRRLLRQPETTMFLKLWLWLFVLYSAAALPLLAFAMANLAS